MATTMFLIWGSQVRILSGTPIKSDGYRLGKTTRMGERSLRRLLVIGAAGVVRWSVRKPPRLDSWYREE